MKKSINIFLLGIVIGFITSFMSEVFKIFVITVAICLLFDRWDEFCFLERNKNNG